MLCVDIGNTDVKFAVVAGDRVLGAERVSVPASSDLDALEFAIRRVSGAVLNLRGAAICSVVPRLTRDVARVVSAHVPGRPFVVEPGVRLPIELAVPVPSSVGRDRICAAVGALGTRGRSAIVVDAGSAVTVDRVREGRFLGGVILPGPATCIEALSMRGAQLPRIDYAGLADRFPDQIDATEPALVLGATLSFVGGVRESIRRVEQLTGVTANRVLTGGFAGELSGQLGKKWRVDPHLVLRGLARIALLNSPADA